MLSLALLLLIVPLFAGDEPLAGCYGTAYIYNMKGGAGNKIKVQIPNRPTAYGRYDPSTQRGRVDFTDDQQYKLNFNTDTGVIDWDGLERPWAGDKRRQWDGTNHWQKDMPDVAGQYYHVTDTSQSGCGAVIRRTIDNRIEVDMTACTSRPIAKGYVNCGTGSGQPFTGSVHFSDDKTYSLAYYPAEGKIYWDGTPGTTSNIWVLEGYNTAAYTEGYYFDPFAVWEEEEVMAQIVKEMEEEDKDESLLNVAGVEIGVIGQANAMIMNYWAIWVVLTIIGVVGLYFGYKSCKSSGKGSYQQLLPN